MIRAKDYFGTSDPAQEGSYEGKGDMVGYSLVNVPRSRKTQDKSIRIVSREWTVDGCEVIHVASLTRLPQGVER
jgi:hypothetical protein